MKQGKARRWAEGWLIAAALGAVLLISLLIWMNRQPRTETVAPVLSVSLETLERAAKININTADAEELDQLPGIGKATAQKIIAHRTANGPYETIEDLLNVPGIGEKTLEKLCAKVRLE